MFDIKSKKTSVFKICSLFILVFALNAIALPVLSEDRILQPNADDMTMERAMEIAFLEAANMLDIAKNEVALLPYINNFAAISIYGDAKRVWIVTFFPDEYQGFTNVACTVAIDSSTGEVIHKDTDYWFNFRNQWEEWGRDDYFFWPAYDKAIFHKMYQKEPTHVIPEDGCLPEDLALDISIGMLKRTYGLVDEEISQYRVDYNFVTGRTVNSDDYAWILIFRPYTPNKYGSYENIYQLVISAADGRVISCDRKCDNPNG